MKGLLKKDFMVVKQTLVLQIAVPVIVIIAMLWLDAGPGILTFLPIYAVMQAVSTILSDRICGWNLYETTFALTRQNAIREKYLLSFLFGLIGLVLGIILFLVTGNDLFSETGLINLCLCGVFVFPVIAAAIPLSILLPRNQFFIAVIASFLIPAFCVVKWSSSITSEAVMTNGIMTEASMNFQIPMLGIMTAACFVICLLSFLLMPSFLASKDQR